MKKQKRRRRFRLIHLTTIFILLYIGVTFWNQNKLMSELQGKKEENIRVNQKLQKEINELEKLIEDSETLDFVERVAREELGMVKPREIMVIDRNKKKDGFSKRIKRDN